jgi:hypothetical protein
MSISSPHIELSSISPASGSLCGNVYETRSKHIVHGYPAEAEELIGLEDQTLRAEARIRGSCSAGKAEEDKVFVVDHFVVHAFMIRAAREFVAEALAMNLSERHEPPLFFNLCNVCGFSVVLQGPGERFNALDKSEKARIYAAKALGQPVEIQVGHGTNRAGILFGAGGEVFPVGAFCHHLNVGRHGDELLEGGEAGTDLGIETTKMVLRLIKAHSRDLAGALLNVTTVGVFGRDVGVTVTGHAKNPFEASQGADLGMGDWSKDGMELSIPAAASDVSALNRMFAARRSG